MGRVDRVRTTLISDGTGARGAVHDGCPHRARRPARATTRSPTSRVAIQRVGWHMENPQDRTIHAWRAIQAHAAVSGALAHLADQHERHLDLQTTIAEIPAPGGLEGERGEFMRRQFERAGLTEVSVDAVGNVLGWRHGRRPESIAIAAHLDTVFPAGTDVTVRREGGRLLGPGVADDSRGLACLVALAEALAAGPLATEHTLLFVADVGEEGLGNLRGITHLFDAASCRDRIIAFISIDGMDAFTITNGAVGSLRYRVSLRGPGGHSYLDFGIVNPICGIGLVIAGLATLGLPVEPRTTCSVGIVAGGSSINAIPAEASFQVDLRSEGAAELGWLDRRFREAVEKGAAEEDLRCRASGTTLTTTIDLLGRRPAGITPATSTLVKAAEWATEAIGLQPVLDSGSTDAAVPTALGVPAICIGGGGTAGELHSLSEWFDPTDAYKGVQRALLTVLAFDAARTTGA